MMEISFTGISASNEDAAALATRTSSFPSCEHSRKRKHSYEVATTLSAVVAPAAAAAANGDHSIWESSKRSRVVEELNPELDSAVQPTCLHKSRFAKRVFVRGKQSSHCAKVVCPLCRRNAISRQWVPSLENEEEFADVKAKLIKELGLFDSDSMTPGIYQDPDSNGQVQPQVFERWGHSQIDADVQFTWPPLENEEEFAEVKAKLMKGLGLFGSGALITGIYRDSSPRGLARLQAFERQEQLTREARGHANVQYAWHGTSKTGVSGIILHGFGQPRTPTNGSAYGVGVYLAPENHADVSAVYADVDKNGEQHILLCRVILGAAELVLQGSDQFHPSSEHFDTGADDLFAPKRLIVWSTHMNTHILPLHVVSFKLAPRWRGKSLHQHMVAILVFWFFCQLYVWLVFFSTNCAWTRNVDYFFLFGMLGLASAIKLEKS
jgi:hypothetical protein